MKFTKARLGFTLIELIIVVAIIAIIAGSVFVAIDPARRLHAARNSTRWGDVTATLEAIKKYQVDNNGALPATATAIDTAATTYQIIGESVTCSGLTCGSLSMAASACGVTGLDTDLAPYLRNIPEDPSTGSSDNTRYYINRDANDIVVIGACDSEGEDAGGGGTAPTIEISR